MNAATVSIIISAYNAERYLAETLDAVIAQTWQHLEVIVVNDGSTDRTREIILQYATHNVKLVDQQNGGQDAALNNGYRHATGQYIKFMDSDDLINPEMIARQMAVLGGSEEHVAYAEWSRFYNDDPNTAVFTRRVYWRDMAPLDFLTSEPNGVMLQCGIMLIPRKIIDRVGLWDERISLLYNDTEFFARVIPASAGVRFSEGAKLYYRSGTAQSVSSKKRSLKYYEAAYLACQLMTESLIPIEDTPRVRRLISNALLMQYYDMYPRFPDMQKKYLAKIKEVGHGNYRVKGGRVLQLLTFFFGWKLARRSQIVAYSLRDKLKT